MGLALPWKIATLWTLFPGFASSGFASSGFSSSGLLLQVSLLQVSLLQVSLLQVSLLQVLPLQTSFQISWLFQILDRALITFSVSP